MLTVDRREHRFLRSLLSLTMLIGAVSIFLVALFVVIGDGIPTEQIAFKGGRDNGVFYLMDVQQNVALPVYRDTLDYPTSIAWSPDGTKFAFIVQQETNSDVFMIDIRTGDSRNLTLTPAREDAPTWLDDDTIAFWSWRDEGFRRVYTMNVNTGDAQPMLDPMIPNADARFALSPEGSRYAMVSYRHGLPEIYVRDVRETESVRLTENAAYDYNPAWSPDGLQLAFWSTRDNDQMCLYVMNADGSDPHPVTDAFASRSDMTWTVTWSSQGDTLAFNATFEGRPAIYTVPASGGTVERIMFFESAFPPALSWRP